MKQMTAMLLIVCLLAALLPVSAFAAGTGWVRGGSGWQYVGADGRAATGVCWIEAEGNRYVFDAAGILQTGDAEGDVEMGGSLYYINPESSPENPSSCYAVRNYTRVRPEGITYYDGDGITFEGWMCAENGRYRYQTRIQRPGQKDLCIYVWRAQYLPERVHPEHPDDPSYNIPAGWYLFDDEGLWIDGSGTHACADGHTYQVKDGRITAQDGKPMISPNFRPVPMSQLANRKSVQSHATEDQLAQAYAVAQDIVAPFADLPVEQQMRSIACTLCREYEYGGDMEYSMSTPHYDDPYGYFILHVRSCAGSTRALGLCLNILGIPYEHVNENEYSHQWCRVNVDGVLWDVDAMAGSCVSESASPEEGTKPSPAEDEDPEGDYGWIFDILFGR